MELLQKNEELSKKITNKESTLEEIIQEGLAATKKRSVKLEAEIEAKIVEIRQLSKKVVELNEEVLLQDFALYKPMYSFAASEQYKFELDKIRQKQKEMLKNNQAASGNMDWTVNGSKSEGTKMVRETQKLLLRAFNSECEHVTDKVKYNNFESCKKRITNSYEAISKLGRTMNISINQDYYLLKINELHLAFEYQQMKEKEKEHQKELREQAREEAKLKKEIAEARKKVQKEKAHYTNALDTAKEHLAAATTQEEKLLLEQKVNDLEAQMTEIDKNIADIDYREANQRAGYVYVISNIGSFGNDIYKIGMTRRLDPMERVNELGDASVPFNFDVHAMIFSEDAPKLEAALHNAFENQKLNMVNTRREFFNVPLEEIEKVVKENYDGSVEFTALPDAEQYRESQKIKAISA